MWAEDVKALGDRLANLAVADAAGLAGYLKEQYGIEAPASAPRVVIGDPPPDPDPVSSTVDVFLKSAGDNKLQVIRVVRFHTALGLVESKALVERAPVIVKSGVDRAEGELIMKELKGQGATVELT